MYDYWFTQFDFPDENGKPYRASGGAMVWCDELKRSVPKEWKIKKIGDILGKYPKTTSILRDDYNLGSKYPIIDQSKDYICGFTDDESRILKMENAVVYGDHTNAVKYVDFYFARGADGTQIINATNDSLPNYLLYLYIQGLPIIDKGYSRHFKFLKEQYVVIPPHWVSEKYMKIAKTQLLQIRYNIFENYKLTALRDWLLPMLMNGQATISD